MSKLHIKKGDLVYVNAGKDKGKEGIVLKVLVDKQRAIVEGCNMITKHAKPSANNPQGGREQVEAAIHISNLNPINPDTKKPAKIGRKVDEKTGKLVRFFKTKKENK